MKKLLTTCLLFFSVSSVLAYEIVELYYRDVREVFPGVQTMLRSGESASVIDNKIILNASPGRERQLAEFIRQFDQKTSMLLVEVEQSGSSSGRGADGAIQGGVVIKHGKTSGYGYGQAGAGRYNQNNNSLQTLRIASGAEGFIELGREQRYINGSYRDVVVGMKVLPRVVGNSVKIDLSADNHGQKLATTVNGQLGQWITLGGIGTDSQGSYTVLLGAGNYNQRSNSVVRVRVSVQ